MSAFLPVFFGVGVVGIGVVVGTMGVVVTFTPKGDSVVTVRMVGVVTIVFVVTCVGSVVVITIVVCSSPSSVSVGATLSPVFTNSVMLKGKASNMRRYVTC